MVNFKVIGSNPVGGLRFFFAPRSWHVEKIISHFISPSLKFTIFLYHKHDDFDIADPRSMQDACQCGLARHESIVAQCLEHPIGVRKIIGSNPVWESRRWILKSLLTKCETSFFTKKRFDEQNNNFEGVSHFFAIFALLRRENAKFYGERKQETTNVYFSFWTWIWSLGIQLQEVSPTFDKLSGRVGRNNRDNDWKNAINPFF